MCPAKAKKSKNSDDQEWKCSGMKEAKPKIKIIHKSALRQLIHNKF